MDSVLYSHQTAYAYTDRYLNSQWFEGAVIDKIKEHVLTSDNITRLIHIVNEETDGRGIEDRQRIEGVAHEIGDVDHRLDRLYDALETGIIQLVDLSPRIQPSGSRKNNCRQKSSS